MGSGSKASKFLLAGSACVLLLSACNSGGDKNENASGSPTASPSASASAEGSGQAPKEEIKIKYTHWGGPAEKKVHEEAVAQFNDANKGAINVDNVLIPTGYDEKLTTMIAGNETPDIGYLESASLAYPLASEGKIVDLSPFLNNDPELNPASLIDNITYFWDDQKVLGIGFGPETFQLFYNADMLSAAGVTAPPADPANAWDWDTFVEMAKKLTIDTKGNNATSPDFDPKNIAQYGVNFGQWWAVWGSFVIANGGDFISEDGTKLTLAEPAAVEAIQKLADLINVHHVAPSPIQAKGLPGTSIALQTKKIAMVIEGQWANVDLGIIKDLNYGVGAIPKMKNGSKTFIVSALMSMFSAGKHQRETWEFYKHMVDPESTQELVASGLVLPTMKDWYTDPAKLDSWAQGNPAHPAGFKENIAATMTGDYTAPSPTSYVINFGKIMDKINPALDKVWLGETSAEEALKSVEASAQQEVQGRRETR